MTVLIDILGIVIGIFFVLEGANVMTDGAVAIAKRMGISEMIIGLTVVACGTSMPEFFVSLTSAFKGSADMAVGNVIGSDIFNTLLIAGLSAIVAPIVIEKSTVRIDIPVACVASLLMGLMCLDGSIGRIDAAILTAGFIIFMAYTVRTAKKQKPGATADDTEQEASTAKSIARIVIGLVLLIGGSQWFVSGASDIAGILGVSDAIIGLTIVAFGTSLPELATSVVAARKGQGALAIGNVLGSNVFNILMVLGVTALISPLQIKGITTVDLILQFGALLMMWLFSYTRYKIERWEGCLLSAVFVIYLAWLVKMAL